MVFSKQISVFSSKWLYWHYTAHYEHDSNDRLVCLNVYLQEDHNYAQFISHYHMEDICGSEKQKLLIIKPTQRTWKDKLEITEQHGVPWRKHGDIYD